MKITKYLALRTLSLHWVTNFCAKKNIFTIVCYCIFDFTDVCCDGLYGRVQRWGKCDELSLEKWLCRVTFLKDNRGGFTIWHKVKAIVEERYKISITNLKERGFILQVKRIFINFY
jgi:hypothetical protein